MFDNLNFVVIEHFVNCYMSTIHTFDGMIYQFQFMHDGTINSDAMTYEEWLR